MLVKVCCVLWRGVANLVPAATDSRGFLEVLPQDYELFQWSSAAEGRETKQNHLSGPRGFLESLPQNSEAFHSSSAAESPRNPTKKKAKTLTLTPIQTAQTAFFASHFTKPSSFALFKYKFT